MPSSNPLPALKMEMNASFFPVKKGASIGATGVSTERISSGKSLVTSKHSNQEISLSNIRNEAEDAVLSRINDSLCCTNGCVSNVACNPLALSSSCVSMVDRLKLRMSQLELSGKFFVLNALWLRRRLS